MINKTFGAIALLTAGFLTACEAPESTGSNDIVIPQPVYDAVFNISVARFTADECQGIRFSRIAADRYIEHEIQKLIRSGVNPMVANAAVRRVPEERLKADFGRYLHENGYNGNRENFCQTGRNAMAQNTAIGNMLAGG